MPILYLLTAQEQGHCRKIAIQDKFLSIKELADQERYREKEKNKCMVHSPYNWISIILHTKGQWIPTICEAQPKGEKGEETNIEHFLQPIGIQCRCAYTLPQESKHKLISKATQAIDRLTPALPRSPLFWCLQGFNIPSHLSSTTTPEFPSLTSLLPSPNTLILSLSVSHWLFNDLDCWGWITNHIAGCLI